MQEVNQSNFIDRGAIERCRAINRHYGKSYFLATRFFPKHIREATWVLYAFFRMPDEMVDTAPSGETSAQTRKRLEQWKEDWVSAYNTHTSTDPVLRATAHVFHQYHIPFSYSEAFLQAMIQDTEKTRYRTYEELESYMYGSAAVVGLMMSCVIGMKDKQAVEYAKKLGYAMQLTNFLRDVREDVDERGRVYIPQEDLKRFGVTEQEIQTHQQTDQFRKLMVFEIDRARRLYQEAIPGIGMLRPEGQRAVRMAANLYAAILQKIEHAKYDVFSQRVRTNFFEKIKICWFVLRDSKK